MEAYYASVAALVLGARPCFDLPAAASNEQSAFECAHMRTRHRTLSLGRRRSTRACGLRATRCAGWSRCLPYEGALRQRDGPLFLCTATLRRASRGLQQAAVLHMCARKSATARALSLGRRRLRALAVCARRAALVGVGPCPMEALCASEMALSLGARPRSDVPAAASNKQLSCACAQEKSATALFLFLSGGVAARALVACARYAALVDIDPRHPYEAAAPASGLYVQGKTVVPDTGLCLARFPGLGLGLRFGLQFTLGVRQRLHYGYLTFLYDGPARRPPHWPHRAMAFCALVNVRRAADESWRRLW